MKDYYAVLGVSDQATAADVLAAWRTRSAVLHPDRFDRVTQAAQWRQANEMFAELKEAHEILSDATRRAEYDRLRGGTRETRRQPPPPARPHVRSAPRRREMRADDVYNPDPRLLADRFVDAGSLPPEGLLSLSRAGHSDVLFRRNDSTLINTIGVVVGFAVCVLTGAAVHGERLDAFGQAAAFGGFAGGAWLVAFNMLRVWLARTTPFGCGLVVTPYYFAEVRWDRTRLTPLLALKNVAIAHRYWLGLYAKTTLRTEWTRGTLSFDIVGKKDTEQLGQVLIDSSNRVHQSFAYGQGEGIIKRFAFAQSVGTLPREDFKSGRIRFAERAVAATAVLAAVLLLALTPVRPY